jgi:hypothetical protein
LRNDLLRKTKKSFFFFHFQSQILAIFGCFHPHRAESDEEVELEEQRPLGQTEEQQTNGVSTSRDAFTARMVEGTRAETTKKVYSSKLARLRKWLLQKHPDHVADGEICLPLPFDVLQEGGGNFERKW